MSEPHERLNEAMNKRRFDVGHKSWRHLAAAAGISYETLRALRKGEGHPAEATMDGVERALGWPSGTIAAILAGEQVQPECADAPGGSGGAGRPGESTPAEEPGAYVPETALERALLDLLAAQRKELEALRREQQEQLEAIRGQLDRLAESGVDKNGRKPA